MGSDRDDRPIDAIDMIINLLKEHEKTLDGLLYRIEEALSSVVQKPSPPPGPAPRAAGFSVVLKDWADFRKRCADAGLIGFVVGGESFKVSAIADGVLYVYEEGIPSLDILYETEDDGLRIEGFEAEAVGLMLKVLRRRLDCGLEFSIRDVEMERAEGKSTHRILCYVEVGAARAWLASEIGISRASILEGELMLREGD